MDRMRRLMLIATSVAMATLLAAGAVLAADSTVTIAGFAFSPATVTIQVGDTVTWTNNDSTAHTATSGDNSIATGNIATGESASVTFIAAGSYAYVCSIHPQMAGTVVVQGAATSAAPTTDGGGVTVTPAPTDTLVATADDDLASSAAAVVLAGLGVLMLAGTFVADRRFRVRRER